MKKFTLLIIIITLALTSFTACGAGDIGGPGYAESKQAENSSTSSALVNNEPAWSDDFAGLQGCFEWRGYVDKNTKVATLADVIGASEGYRYKEKVGKSEFSIELYSYDPNNLNDTAKNIKDQIKATGYFTMLQTNISASVSDNGKYIMVYTDSSTDEDNIRTKQTIEKVFVSFQ